jgi:hypothetical protein
MALLKKRGASFACVQKQAGHKSMDITLNTYGHFVPGRNRSAGVDLLDSRGRKRRRATSSLGWVFEFGSASPEVPPRECSP